MNIPDRVHASRQHKEPPGTKRVCRPSKYGNDYKIKQGRGSEFGWNMIPDEFVICVVNDKTGYISLPLLSLEAAHKHAVEMFKSQMRVLLDNNSAYYDSLLFYWHISCFCPPHLPCHCDAIIAHLKRRAAELEQVTA